MRARIVKAHLGLEDYLSSARPRFGRKRRWLREVVGTLPETYRQLSDVHGIPIGDFPELEKMRSKIQHMDQKRFEKVKRLDKRKLKQIDEILSVDIPALLKQVGKETVNASDTA